MYKYLISFLCLIFINYSCKKNSLVSLNSKEVGNKPEFDEFFEKLRDIKPNNQIPSENPNRFLIIAVVAGILLADCAGAVVFSETADGVADGLDITDAGDRRSFKRGWIIGGAVLSSLATSVPETEDFPVIRPDLSTLNVQDNTLNTENIYGEKHNQGIDFLAFNHTSVYPAGNFNFDSAYNYTVTYLRSESSIWDTIQNQTFLQNYYNDIDNVRTELYNYKETNYSVKLNDLQTSGYLDIESKIFLENLSEDIFDCVSVNQANQLITDYEDVVLNDTTITQDFKDTCLKALSVARHSLEYWINVN